MLHIDKNLLETLQNHFPDESGPVIAEGLTMADMGEEWQALYAAKPEVVDGYWMGGFADIQIVIVEFADNTFSVDCADSMAGQWNLYEGYNKFDATKAWETKVSEYYVSSPSMITYGPLFRNLDSTGCSHEDDVKIWNKFTVCSLCNLVMEDLPADMQEFTWMNLNSPEQLAKMVAMTARTWMMIFNATKILDDPNQTEPLQIQVLNALTIFYNEARRFLGK